MKLNFFFQFKTTRARVKKEKKKKEYNTIRDSNIQEYSNILWNIMRKIKFEQSRTTEHTVNS